MDKDIYSKYAGILAFLGTFQFIIMMIIAEAEYAGYSIRNNYISDLGVGSTAPIFNISIIIFGLFIAIASYMVYKGTNTKLFPSLMFIAGLGAFLVGVFPEYSPYHIHTIVSFITFFFGSLAVISSFRLQKSLMSYISIVVGLFSLVSLFLYIFGITLGIGFGGLERMIAYPVLLWTLYFSGYLYSLKPN
ncbi:MAG: DUF998 domain-containing protein [Nitrososphaeria archaeon]|nr:DUF998 domain-containing protein [Conexivisphaerales archaeon]